MRARIKGTNDSFREVTGIEIDYAIYEYDPEVIEFENDFIPNNTTTEDEHWQHVHERAAIAAMQGTMSLLSSSDRYAFREIVVEGFSGTQKTYPNEIAE